MSETTTHPIIGEVTMFRTARSTRISLSVRSDGSVRLSFPLLVSEKQALKFLDEKADWIAATREKMSKKYTAVTAPIADGYRTRTRILRFLPHPNADKIYATKKENEIVIVHPADIPHTAEKVQQTAEKAIVEVLRTEAKGMLPPLVARLAAEHGFPHGEVRVKASKSKWGSCTVRNDINLSLFLMLLPDRLVEYIVLHELCHTVHRDHSSRFHTLLDCVTGGAHRALNRELRNFRPDVRHKSIRKS
jgi:predicted metal-dependent hydrolase